MDTRTAQFDPLEHYRAAAQLDQIMLANRNSGWAACREMMVEWHLAAVRTARTDSPVPRGHSERDPNEAVTSLARCIRQAARVEETIIRFYQYQVRITVERLKNENEEPPSPQAD